MLRVFKELPINIFVLFIGEGAQLFLEVRLITQLFFGQHDKD